jgi:hypothetical protein
MLFVQHLRDWRYDCVAFFTNRWIGIEKPFDVGAPGYVIVLWHLIVIAKGFHPASDGKRAKGITYISGFRIFSALEVAGDVFSRADVGQQLVELRRSTL